MNKSLIFCFLVCILGYSCESENDVKNRQYFVNGAEKYKLHCANCHQDDGVGLAGLYPPLKDADYLLKNKELILCAMQKGLKDTIVVNGQRYTQPMPANNQLYAIDIAEIATYVYNKWGNEKTRTDVKDVELVLKKCR
jgi:cytochrome c551